MLIINEKNLRHKSSALIEILLRAISKIIAFASKAKATDIRGQDMILLIIIISLLNFVNERFKDYP